MDIDAKKLAVAFFIPIQKNQPDLNELIKATQFDPNHHQWANLTGAHLITKTISPDFFLVFIDFWASSFLEKLHEENTAIEKDGAIDVVEIFVENCLQLKAKTGLFLTHKDQASMEWVSQLTWMVLSKDGDSLLSESLGLTWFDSDFSFHPQSKLGRDEWPVTKGHLIFANHGINRWF